MRVSVITPTANRPDFLRRAIAQFLAQDYEDKELVIIGDIDDNITAPPNELDKIKYLLAPTNIGTKRNIGCQYATGEIILHMDDDDRYSNDWIAKSVEALGSKEMTGLDSCYFYERDANFWKFTYSGTQKYIIGATMCYRKSYWQKKPFKSIQKGEDTYFCTHAIRDSHDYINGFCATIHGANTCSQNAIKTMKKLPLEDYKRIFPKFV